MTSQWKTLIERITSRIFKFPQGEIKLKKKGQGASVCRSFAVENH